MIHFYLKKLILVSTYKINNVNTGPPTVTPASDRKLDRKIQTHSTRKYEEGASWRQALTALRWPRLAWPGRRCFDLEAAPHFIEAYPTAAFRVAVAPAAAHWQLSQRPRVPQPRRLGSELPGGCGG